MERAEAVIEVEDLEVRYGTKKAVAGISFRFEGGALGLLGPNGAGKSSLLRALLGLVRPARGRAVVLGTDSRAAPLSVRATVGYVPENDCHIPGMTGVEFVTYCGRLAGLSARDAKRRAHEVLVYVGMEEERYRNVEGYSRGMRQKAKFAAALVHDPAVLFLDEPTNGLDPQARAEVLALVRELWRDKGLHIVLSSHLLRDVEEVCERVVVLSEGRLRTEGAIDELEGDATGFFVAVSGPADRFVGLLRDRGFEVERDERGRIHVRSPEGEIDPRVLFALAREAGTPLARLESARDTLEDVFLRVVSAEDA